VCGIRNRIYFDARLFLNVAYVSSLYIIITTTTTIIITIIIIIMN